MQKRAREQVCYENTMIKSDRRAASGRSGRAGLAFHRLAAAGRARAAATPIREKPSVPATVMDRAHVQQLSSLTEAK